MPTQSDHIPYVPGWRGAPLGRPSIHRDDYKSRWFYLRFVKLDTSGYDAGGAYWGRGDPLYWCGDLSLPGDEISFFFRLDVDWRKLVAIPRNQAKTIVRKIYPQARFRK